MAKLATFGAASAISGGSSLLLVVTVVGVSGLRDWSALALGQSIGQVAGLFVICGWNLTGARRVAAASGMEERAAILHDGVRVRVIIGSMLAPAVVWIGLVIGEFGSWQCAIAAVAYLAQGFSLLWFYTGLGRPTSLLLFEALPRGLMLCITAAVVVVLGFGPALVVLMCGSVLSALCSYAGARRLVGGAARGRSRTTFRAEIALGRAGLVNDLVGALYTLLPTIVVAILAPSGLGVFSLADRVQRFFKVAIVPVMQYFQSYVFAAIRTGEQGKRIGSTLRWFILLSTVSALGFVLVCSLIGAFQWPKDTFLVGAMAASLLFSVLSLGTGFVALVALGAHGAVARSAACGGALAAVVLGPVTLTWGHEGAAWTLAVTEMCVLAYQVAVLRRLLSRGLPLTAE